MRGDNLVSRLSRDASPSDGPPPHAWGQRPDLASHGTAPRSTPTCVGTTSDRRWPIWMNYGPPPHAWGTTQGRWGSKSAEHGPPPHAWGQRSRGKRCISSRRSTPTCVGTTPRRGRSSISEHCRSTPTCVGTTLGQRSTCRFSPVHPHMRGDNGGSRWVPTRTTGPPPHAWGQRFPFS